MLIEKEDWIECDDVEREGLGLNHGGRLRCCDAGNLVVASLRWLEFFSAVSL